MSSRSPSLHMFPAVPEEDLRLAPSPREPRHHSRSPSVESGTTAPVSVLSLGGATEARSELAAVPEDDLDDPHAGTTYQLGEVTVEFPSHATPDQAFLRITQPTVVLPCGNNQWQATLPGSRDVDGQPISKRGWRPEVYPASLLRLSASETLSEARMVRWVDEAVSLSVGDYAHLPEDLRSLVAQAVSGVGQVNETWYLRRLQILESDPSKAVWEYEQRWDWTRPPEPEILVTDGEHTRSVRVAHLDYQNGEWRVPAKLDLATYDPMRGIESDGAEEVRRLVENMTIT